MLKHLSRPLLIAAALSFTLPGFASEDKRPGHFKGKPSPTLEEAFDNLASYNRKLETLLAGELTPQVMAEIHQTTYTLENALKKIESEVDDLAETLEEVHLASESNDTATTSNKGRVYLGVAQKLARQ